MNREIKFRVWDNVDYMSYPFNLYDIINGRLKFTSECSVMQYTGLKDKNGKEIYEGDILSKKVNKYQDNWASEMVHKSDNYIEVSFINGSFSVSYTGTPLSDFIKNIVSREVEYEVIGNIYENPELLKP